MNTQCDDFIAVALYQLKDIEVEFMKFNSQHFFLKPCDGGDSTVRLKLIKVHN